MLGAEVLDAGLVLEAAEGDPFGHQAGGPLGWIGPVVEVVFLDADDDGGNGVTAATEIAKGDGRGFRDLGENGGDGGVAGQAGGDFGEQIRKGEAVGDFESGEGIEEERQLPGIAAGFDGDGLEAGAGRPVMERSAGEGARAEFVAPAFDADTVGGVAAVGDEADLSTFFADGVGEGGGGGDGEFDPRGVGAFELGLELGGIGPGGGELAGERRREDRLTSGPGVAVAVEIEESVAPATQARVRRLCCGFRRYARSPASEYDGAGRRVGRDGCR